MNRETRMDLVFQKGTERPDAFSGNTRYTTPSGFVGLYLDLFPSSETNFRLRT